MHEPNGLEVNSLESDFRNVTRAVLYQYRQLELTNPALLMSGPTYELVTKSGQPLRCLTVGYKLSDKPITRLDIFGIQGDQAMPSVLTRVKIDDSGSVPVASSDTNTGRRGEGLARPAMLVYFDLIQREANRRQQPIQIVEEDVNGQQLAYLKQLRQADIEDTQYLETLEAQHAAALAERPRWLALYGDQGSLGFKGLKKLIEPQLPGQSVVRLEQPKRIQLETNLKDGQPVVIAEQPLANDEQADYASSLRQQLNHWLARLS